MITKDRRIVVTIARHNQPLNIPPTGLVLTAIAVPSQQLAEEYVAKQVAAGAQHHYFICEPTHKCIVPRPEVELEKLEG